MDKNAIEKKWKLVERLKEARKEILEFDNLAELKANASRKQADVQRFIERKEPLVGGSYINKKEEIGRLTREADQAKQQYLEAQNKSQNLREEIDNVNDKLQNIQIKVTQNDLVEFQTKKSKVEVQIQKIAIVIETEEEKKDAFYSSEECSLSALAAKKESILADRVLGEKIDPKELENLEEQIRHEEQNRSELVDIAIETEHTISGLRRKLDTLNDQLALMERQHQEIIEAFLLHELKISGKKNTNLAEKFSTSMMRIVSLKSMLISTGVSSAAISRVVSGLDLPELRPNGSVESPGQLFYYRTEDKLPALKSLKNEIATMGIDIP